MLEYVKTVLLKVSFDRVLFEKELRKGLNLLLPNEVREFRAWCYKQFGKPYEPVLDKYFVGLAG
ncbi:hypothetical protein A3SI_07914 [Nitritalea halalkaliphila LW7]|uniref:Uncharacterized protein n=1 Tax=Nitritalea halalkaliphila LW7 TaxID=1189621 RepID=I5C5U1_9BACT|nr:hypothetical protein [Nitritalea halalkaliphila]EIM77193.1 hypothetical protein A3SI_07914 [Nitritalea halalkaliphila LW7]